MTSRVRFTPFVRAGLFAAAAALPRPATAGQVPLVGEPPFATGVDTGAVVAGDIDGDGDPDVVATGAAVLWYARDGTGAWTPHTIHPTAGHAIGLAVGDIDRDGDLDVAISAFTVGFACWAENASGDGTAWTIHTLATLTSPRGIALADLDRDGDLDVVVGSQNRVAWYQNVPGGGPFTLRTITTLLEGPDMVVPADVDSDGDLDVVIGGYVSFPSPGAFIHWMENTNGAGTAWSAHFVSAEGYGGNTTLVVGDLDRDGDVDLVADVSIGLLNTFTNANGSGTVWTVRTIDSGGDGAGTPSLADLDGDGDLDIVSGFRGTLVDRVHWFENSGDGIGWTNRTITTSEQGPRQPVVADFDRDGDADVVVGTSVADRLVLFRDDALHRNACFGSGQTIATGADGIAAVLAADLDGDGSLDVASAMLDGDRVDWHRNTGGGNGWITLPVGTALDGVLALASGDLDRDGDLDLASASVVDNHVSWHERSGEHFTTHLVGTQATQPISVGAGDIDGDGDLDLLAASYYGGLRWFANGAGGASWTPGVVSGGTRLSQALGDVDGDGDLDVVTSVSFFDPTMAWYENAGGGAAWSPHVVATLTPGPAYGAAVADLDGDGDADLLSAEGGPPGGLHWFANAGGGASFTTGTIAAGSWTSVATGDLDRDGDADVLSTSSVSPSVAWHENAGGATGWTPHTIATSEGESRSVAAADVDRDGDLDLVAAFTSQDRVAWYRNQGGQVSLDAADIAPPGAMNGDLVAMLRMVATHRGRAGDGDAELSALGLLFEESAGDPLTTAEAQALLASLRVYRDANGSGVFEPQSDALVVSLTTLSLVGGVQAVTLPDGDGNARVAFGAPQTFFVVAELTPDASAQVPNRFRVTLLENGPAASTLEDRTYDIRLALACPADVSSGVLSTPVELMRFSIE